MKKPELKVHEWLAVVFIVGLLVTLTAISLLSRGPSMPEVEEAHVMVEPTIEVRIEGAVEFPGVLHLKKGTTLGDAIILAKPLPEADLSKIKLEKKMRKPTVLRVPSQTHIDVKIAGMGSLKVTRGTRFNELKRLLANPEQYEKTQFKSKRLLKEGETLYLKLEPQK